MRIKKVSLVITAGLVMALAACSNGGGASTSATPSDSASAAQTTAPEESASGAAGGSDATLTVWVDETRKAAVDKVAQQFEADKGVKVEVVQKNYDDLRADFISQVPTGEGPDITVGANDWLGELKTNGVVAPIELGDSAGDFQDVAIKAFTSDGQVYALPYAVENIAIVRNTALADSTPATWDEMIAKGKEAGTKYPFLMQISDKGDPYTMVPFQNSFDAPVFKQEADGSYTAELGMGGDSGAAFAGWLNQQGAAGAGILSSSLTYDIVQDAFTKGESPYILTGPWMISAMTDAGLDVAIDPIPAAGPSPSVPFVGVQGFYLSAQSKNALVATDFLVNYLSTEDVQMALYQAGGRPPALKAAAEKAAEDPIIAGFSKVGETGIPMPSIPEMNSVWVPLGTTEASIVDGKEGDPAAAWQTMVDNIANAIKK